MSLPSLGNEASEEVQALQKESQMNLDELLDSLPPGYVEAKLKELPPMDSRDGDDDFKPDVASDDEEATIEEQEKHENDADHERELAALKVNFKLVFSSFVSLVINLWIKDTKMTNFVTISYPV
jgi:hypothetical protein